ncbi:reticulon-like protein B17 isoform X1 [Daucus carota subsp. sativus]|uniref:reticulon-like protein B17 isoform X1 n=1 Tax=Daucus carota subsp. sativus TaxID=79200 RepID=UPI0030838CAA
MDSITPPPYRSDPKSRTKSASRLARITNEHDENSPNLSLELVLSSPKLSPPINTTSPKSYKKLHELLLLSPSPQRKSRTRLADKLEFADQDPLEPNGSRRRHRSRNGAVGSPKNVRRSRRRFEQEIREERELGGLEDLGKPRKRRNSGRSKKEAVSSVPSVPHSKSNDGDGCNFDRFGQLITDLVMWKDVARSTLWFGFGSLCFLSSCFTKGVSFSIFSLVSHLGLLALGVRFFTNSICKSTYREISEDKRDTKLKEDDILKAARLILPAANLAISKVGEIFSGDPSTTLKVIPFLLLGSEYGHLITLWRLCALGFFMSFSGPKLYSSYSLQINEKVKFLTSRASVTWGALSHKKIVAGSVATAFWNLTSVRTRIFTVFIILVIVRYRSQYLQPTEEEKETEEIGEDQQQAEEDQQHQEEDQQHQEHDKALVVVESGSKLN